MSVKATRIGSINNWLIKIINKIYIYDVNDVYKYVKHCIYKYIVRYKDILDDNLSLDKIIYMLIHFLQR